MLAENNLSLYTIIRRLYYASVLQYFHINQNIVQWYTVTILGTALSINDIINQPAA